MMKNEANAPLIRKQSHQSFASIMVLASALRVSFLIEGNARVYFRTKTCRAPLQSFAHHGAATFYRRNRTCQRVRTRITSTQVPRMVSGRQQSRFDTSRSTGCHSRFRRTRRRTSRRISISCAARSTCRRRSSTSCARSRGLLVGRMADPMHAGRALGKERRLPTKCAALGCFLTRLLFDN